MTERWTLGKLSASAAELLGKKGFDAPRLEADLLLAEVLGLDRMDLYTRFDMPVDDAPRAAFRELIKRRLTHEPIAYILGHRDFMDWTVKVEPGVLIPRPETEHLVGAAVAGLASDEAARVLEVGVGSGCLILSILKARPLARGLGLDVEPIPLRVSRANAEALELGERFEARQSDRFLAVADDPEWGQGLQLIVSNPPYIRPDEREGLDPDVRDFEPSAALFYPGDGLEFHRLVLTEGSDRLAESGFFVLELPGTGAAVLADFCRRELPTLVTALLHDYGGRERVLVAQKSTWNPTLLSHLKANSASF